MDDEKDIVISEEVKKIAQDVEKMAEAELGEDLDSVEGFRKFLKKRIANLSCVKGELGSQDAASRYSVSSTSSSDFTEYKTSFVAQETSSEPPDMDSDRYDFSHQKRGLAVIINNEDFHLSKDFGDRPGSSYDASAVHKSLLPFGFDVWHFRDLTGWKMVEVLKAATTDYDHRLADCFVCCILTHGDETWSNREWDRIGSVVRQDLLFGVDGKAVATKFVVELFNDVNCPGLQHKPRLFFLQACRGNKLDHGQDIRVTIPRFTHGIRPHMRDNTDGGSQLETQTDMDTVDSHSEREPWNTPTSSSVDPPEFHVRDFTDAKPAADDDEEEEEQVQRIGRDKPDATWAGGMRDVPVTPAPLFKDCLVMYATPPGHFAWRRRNGAWFIQCLCRVLDSKILAHKSLANALIYVSGMVAREYQSENPGKPNMHEKKEVPVIETMLIKDIYLTRKARH